MVICTGEILIFLPVTSSSEADVETIVSFGLVHLDGSSSEMERDEEIYDEEIIISIVYKDMEST